MAVGLSILLADADQTYGYHPDHSPYDSGQRHMVETNMFIVRPVINLSRTMITEPQSQEVVVEFESAYCYLKSCHFCHKKLLPEDDIYMYKGDQGYCTDECRSKQIKMDRAEEENEERQYYMKNLAMRKQHRMISQQNSGKCNETLSILCDLTHGRRKPVPLQRNGGIFF